MNIKVKFPVIVICGILVLFVGASVVSASTLKAVTQNCFTDVNTGHWFHDYVCWMYDNGLTVGYPDGTYRPLDNINRAEVAVFMQRVYELAEANDDDTTYSEGDGLALAGTQFSADFAGSGSATTVARSDQDHWGQTWTGSGTGLTLSGGTNGLTAVGTTYGVTGTATSGRGVSGYSNATSSAGVYGQSSGTSGAGVVGYVGVASGTTFGVTGTSLSTSGTGVKGYASASSGTTYGVYGRSNSTSGYDFYAAGSYTNYGPFTGAHEVRLAVSFPLDVKAGMIVSATGEAQARHGADGGVEISSTLPTVRLADMAEDKSVFGALVSEVTLPEDHWVEAGEDERFASVNALGEGRVWVSSINGGIEAGDYITTSALPGYGQRQNDDLLHSYTLGKATETVNWDKVTETVMYNGQEYEVYLIAVVYTSG